MNKKLVSVLASAVVLLAACSTSGSNKTVSTANQDTIKVGGNFELTGKVATYGTSIRNGIAVSFEQTNNASGVLGKKLELVELDNKSDVKESASVATKLTQSGIVGILGPATTGDAQAQIPVATKSKLPVILPAATGDKVVIEDEKSNKPYDYIFRTAFNDSFQGKILAKYATDKNLNRVVVLQDASSDYAKGISTVFAENYTGTVVLTENFQSKDKDFNAILSKVKSLDFDAIIVFGYYEEGGPIIKQAREMGIEHPIVGGDGLASSTLLELAGAQNVRNVYYVNHFTTLTTDEKVQKFMADYKAKFNQEPDAFAALGYDAAGWLAQALKEAGQATPEKLTKALANTKEYKGVTGTFSIGADHNVVKSAYIVELQNGKEVGFTVVNPK